MQLSYVRASNRRVTDFSVYGVDRVVAEFKTSADVMIYLSVIGINGLSLEDLAVHPQLAAGMHSYIKSEPFIL
jgi:hypothetical protein